ncbi:MAG TPA: four helix bundle protein [Gemmatimonadaceae bacterium]|nr:four helix bundle protein [Gemmatimonadaceae bacterium]
MYQAARELALEVYAVARVLPAEERFELSRQLRRAAVSVGSNIAEGCGRATRRDLCGFLDVALGSSRELEFQLDLVERAGLTPAEVVRPALETTRRVQQMLTRLIVQIRIRSRDPDDG